MTRVLLVLFALLAVGCGAPVAAGENTTPVSNDGAGCHKERPLGSNIEREVCRTPDQARDDREDARNLMTPGKVPPRPTAATP